MRFKLDENLGTRGAQIFSEFGHDVEKDLYELVRRLATATTDRDLYGKLWIVQMAGIREYQPDN